LDDLVDIEIEEIEIKIQGIKPVSTNDMYFPMSINAKTKSGRTKAIFASTPALRSYHNEIAEFFKYEIEKSVINKIKKLLKDKSYEPHIEYEIYMPGKKFERADASNYIKSLEDSIAKFFRVDDRFNKSAKCEKFVSNDENWKIVARFIFVKVDN